MSLDEVLGAWRALAERDLQRARASARTARREGAEAEFAAGMARLDLLEQGWRRELAAEVESRLEREAGGYRCEISVRQSELDDIAELVGARRDAPYGAVRDRVAELARAGDQLRMAT